MIVLFKNDVDYFDYMVDDTGCLCEKKINNPFLKYVCNIHRSVKLNRIINMPFKSIWYKYYLDYSKLSVSDKIFFLFFEGNQLAYDKAYILYLRKKFPKAKFIFRYTNMKYSLNEWTFAYVEKVYDLIITMDVCDSNSDKWVCYSNTYNLSKIKQNDGNKCTYDLFFVGRDKGRHDELLKLYYFLTNKNMNCLFLLYGVDKKKQVKNLEGIKYIDFMKYKDIVEYILSSKCILEIVQNSQKGSSLRPMETIVYEKKLLTNNSNIVNYDYYNDENMFVFSEVEDIDIDFIKTEAKVSNRDKDKISSKKLFDMIENYFCVEEGDV